MSEKKCGHCNGTGRCDNYCMSCGKAAEGSRWTGGGQKYTVTCSVCRGSGRK